MRGFGISGVFEEDDVDVCFRYEVRRGRQARAEMRLFRNRAQFLATVNDFPGPGTAYYPYAAQSVQFNLLRRWKALMRTRNTPAMDMPVHESLFARVTNT